MAADSLSHYEILEKLGQGGMGIVYKARDARLGRIVALKVLPPGDFADSARKNRLIQEARSASALNHPHIVTIYDIGEEDGKPFIAMEYVAGRTLGQLIPRRGMKVDEVLRLAVQVADALSAAHRAGIIHRDLKPGNVMVTESGLVKVLDFGLAKVEEATSSSDAETRTRAVETDDGRIVGTVAYMSPEQAQGKPLDARSDIFSLGVMLYEMLTGHRPFAGDTPMSTAAAILNQEPTPLKGDGADLPPEVSRVVMRCLRKDPNRRFQTMADLKVALAELQEESESGRLSGPAAPTRMSGRRNQLLAYTGAGLVVILLTGAAVWLKKPEAAPKRTPVRITTDGLAFAPKLSRDGKLVAYSSIVGGDTPHIWVRQTAGGQAMQVSKGGDSHLQPEFAPDGTRIVFASDGDGGGMYVVPTFGGEPQLLVKGGVSRPVFSPDGKEIAYLAESFGWVGSLSVVPAAGGASREVCPNWNAFSFHWSPDGQSILFLGVRSDRKALGNKWWLVPASGGEPREFSFSSDHKADGGDRSVQAWTRTHSGREWIVYTSTTGDSRNLFRIAVSASGKADGTGEQLTSGAGLIAEADLSADGQLVFTPGTRTGEVWTVPADPDRAKATGQPEEVARSEGMINHAPAISRDGRWLTYAAANSASGDTSIRLRDLRGGTEREVVGGAGWKGQASITPDGSHVAYMHGLENSSTTFLAAASGGVPTRLCSVCFARGFSSDGSILLTQQGWNAGRARIVALRVPSGESKDFLMHADRDLWHAFFSWDDRWVSFKQALEGSPDRIMIAPVRNGVAGDKREWVSVTDGKFGDDKPQWSPDGNTLYFTSIRDGHLCIWAQRLEKATKRPLGEPIAVQHLHDARWWVSRDITAECELSVARDKIVISLLGWRGDIWSMKLE